MTLTPADHTLLAEAKRVIKLNHYIGELPFDCERCSGADAALPQLVALCERLTASELP